VWLNRARNLTKKNVFQNKVVKETEISKGQIGLGSMLYHKESSDSGVKNSHDMAHLFVAGEKETEKKKFQDRENQLLHAGSR